MDGDTTTESSLVAVVVGAVAEAILVAGRGTVSHGHGGASGVSVVLHKSIMDKQVITSESLKDLMCLGTTWYQLESCRGHGSCLTLYYDCKTC